MNLLPPNDCPPDDLEALRDLCSAARATQRSYLERVLAHDWSAYPRIHQRLRGLVRPVTDAALQETAREFVTEAIEALEPLYPTSGDRVTAMQALREHVLEGHSWEAIRTALLEQGLNVSVGTLKNRQKAALMHVLAWAREEAVAVEEPPLESHPMASGSSPGIRHRSFRLPLAFATFLALATLAIALLGHRGDAPVVFEEPLVGVNIALRPTQATLDPPYPPYRLPRGARIYRCALLLPQRFPGDARFVLGTDDHGVDPGDLFLWDAAADSLLWHARFSVRPESLRTTAGQGPDLGHDNMGVKELCYRGPGADLGGRIAASLRHFYAPAAVAIVELETGRVTGCYIHTAHLTSATVLPIGSGQTPLLVMGGTDTAVRRAALVALDPTMGRGVASTVFYKQDHGTDDGVWRVIFPEIDPIEETWALLQMHVDQLPDRGWNPIDHTMRVPIGFSQNIAYYAVLKLGEARVDSVWVELGDRQVRLWQEHGLDVDSLRAALQEQLMVVPGAVRAD